MKMFKKNFPLILRRITSKQLIRKVVLPQNIAFVYYSPKEKDIEKIVSDLSEGYQRIFQFFGFGIPSLKLVLLYTRKEMDELRQEKTPSWLVGQADKNTICLFSPSVFEKESIHKRSEFKKVLFHEMTHLFICQIHSSFEPRWLEEGLAYFVAGQRGKEFDSRFFLNQELPFLIDIERRWQKALPHGAYTISFLLVEFLIKRFGKEKIIKFLSSLQGKYNRKKLCQNFRQIYGQEITEVVEEFLDNNKLKRKDERR